ncbi:MAG: TolC family protein [Chlorobiaceae bacterium]|nr:TolC family protein [Chlorobiaceae bacterium]
MRRLRSALFLFVLMAAPGISSAKALPVETLDWNQCLTETAAHHPDLQSAAQSVFQAQAQRDIVKGGLLPSVSASLGGDRSVSNIRAPIGSWSYGLNASQLLFDGAKTCNLVNAASESIKASRYSMNKVSSSTRLALRTAFVQLMTAQRQVALAAEIAEKRRQNLRLIGLLYQSGTENIGSKSKANADLAAAEFEVAQAKRGLELAQVVLSTELGRENFRPIRASGQFVASEQTGKLPDFDTIVHENPVYLNLVAQKESSRFNLLAAGSAFMPTVSVSSGMGNSSFSQLPPDRTDWQVGVNVAVPIFQGGSGKATVAKARSVLNQLSYDEKSIFFSLMRSLQLAWKNFIDASDYVVVQKKYLDAATERARIADAQYSSGLVTFNEWTIIEDNLVNAKKSFLNAQSNLLITEANWIQAKGGTLETR